MITYEYECWKCDQWHKGTTQSQEELTAIAQDVGVAVRVVDGEITCNDCGKPAKNENAIIHDNGDKFCYECQ